MMAHEMTQCLVDMIMEQDEHHHAQLLALMILSVGDEYLQRTGIGERRDNRWIVGVRSAEPHRHELATMAGVDPCGRCDAD